MRLDENHEIRSVVANRVDIVGGHTYGDIYESVERLQKDHPYDEPVFGAVVIDTRTGKLADGYADWYENAEAAYTAWRTMTAKPFRLTLEYDGKGTLTVKYNDGSDDERYSASTIPAIQRLASNAIDSAAMLEHD